MEHATEVYAPGPTRFNMVGQKVPTQMHLTEERISRGLATRLHRYAEQALDAEGFLDAVAGWEVTIGTDNADEYPGLHREGRELPRTHSVC